MLLPAMLETLRARDLEVVIGSRYLEPGGLGNWAGGSHPCIAMGYVARASRDRRHIERSDERFFLWFAATCCGA
jgi:hypothetical protein